MNRHVEAENANAVGCLGRTLSVFGLAWAGLVVLGGLGILEQLGMSPALVAALGGSIIPALIFIAVGRGIQKRSGAGTPQPSSRGPSAQIPRGQRGPGGSRLRPSPRVTPPILPGGPVPGPAAPKPPAPRPVEPPPIAPEAAPTITEPERGAPVMESKPGQHTVQAPRYPSTGIAKPDSPKKTSKQMIEEARRKWGSGRR